MVTEFGRSIRVLRATLGITLREMANNLNVSSAFLSAVETGKKSVPDELVSKICDRYELENSECNAMRQTAISSRDEIRINIKNANTESKQLVAAFARRFSDLDDETLAQIRELLGEER